MALSTPSSHCSTGPLALTFLNTAIRTFSQLTQHAKDEQDRELTSLKDYQTKLFGTVNAHNRKNLPNRPTILNSSRVQHIVTEQNAQTQENQINKATRFNKDHYICTSKETASSSSSNRLVKRWVNQANAK
jgi:hypothetical protein